MDGKILPVKISPEGRPKGEEGPLCIILCLNGREIRSRDDPLSNRLPSGDAAMTFKNREIYEGILEAGFVIFKHKDATRYVPVGPFLNGGEINFLRYRMGFTLPAGIPLEDVTDIIKKDAREVEVTMDNTILQGGKKVVLGFIPESHYIAYFQFPALKHALAFPDRLITGGKTIWLRHARTRCCEQAKEQQKEQPKEQPKGQPKEQPNGQTEEHSKGQSNKQPKKQSKKQPKEQPKERPKELPKERPKKQKKEQTKEQPKEQTKEQPKKKTKEQTKEQPKEISEGEIRSDTT